MKPSFLETYCVHISPGNYCVQHARLFLPGSLALLLGVFSSDLFANTASPHTFQVRQSDGSAVSLHIRGDEYFNWLEDYAAACGNKIAAIRNAGVRGPGLTGAAPCAAPSASTAPTGQIPSLVVMIRFANHTIRTLPSAADVNVLFNAVGGKVT